MSILRETLSGGAAELGIKLADNQLDQFEKFYHMVVETNKSFNLTHFYNRSLSSFGLPSGWDYKRNRPFQGGLSV